MMVEVINALSHITWPAAIVIVGIIWGIVATIRGI